MHRDALNAEPDAGWQAAVCVVGAGPAGLVVADALARQGVDVVLIESGGDSAGPAGGLNAGTVDGWTQDLCASRGRGVGGTATLWNTIRHGEAGAKYVPLDTVDLLARAELPHSGWPFGFDELAPWYRAARELLGVAEDAAGTRRDPRLPSLPFPPESLTTDVYRWGPAALFCRTLPERLRQHGNVTLLTNATVTSMSSSDRGVEAVHWTTLDGRRGTVSAQSFVLALGAIENARFLLAPGPAAARHRWLGRGLMEHPIDRSLTIVSRHRALSPVRGGMPRKAEPGAKSSSDGSAVRESCSRRSDCGTRRCGSILIASGGCGGLPSDCRPSAAVTRQRGTGCCSISSRRRTATIASRWARRVTGSAFRWLRCTGAGGKTTKRTGCGWRSPCSASFRAAGRAR